jgi:hypothetical protein
MSGTNVESMAIKRYRRGKYVVAIEKSLFSTSGLTGGAVQRLWSDAQTPDSVCTTRRIGYNHCESPAMVAGAMLSGKSRIEDHLSSQKMLERRTAYIAWTAWLAGLVWLVVAYLSRTVQPNFWPLLILVMLQLLSAVVGLAIGLWHLWRGTRRLAAAGWMLLGMGPVCLWAAYVSYGIWFVQGRQLEPNLMRRVSRPALLASADAVAHVLYPERTEGRYVVMIHNGVLDSPQKDVAAMDRHLERMQELLGRKMRSKVRWVRGSLLGVSRRGGLGWALGTSDTASRETDELSSLDRHEAAHAILATLEHGDVRVPLNRAPPAILSEGWAEVQSGCSDQTLLQNAWEKRRRGLAYSLQEFTREEWYRRSWSPAYIQGGPLVEYILHRFGAQKFFELYMTCRRASFAEDCKRVLGLSLDELDRAYWDYVEQQIDPEGIGGLSHVQLAPNVDELLWREVVREHLAAADRVRQTTLSGLLRAQSKTSTEYPHSEPPRNVVLSSVELVCKGNRWRYEKRNGQHHGVTIANPDCSFSFEESSDEEGRKWRAETRIGTQLWRFSLNRSRILALALEQVMWRHYSLADGEYAVWNARSKPFVNRLERVSRNGRDLVLVAFENRGELRGCSRYTSGELCFDPASCWAIRFASLRSKGEDGDVSQDDLSFEFQMRENEPPLLRSAEAVWRKAGKTETIQHSAITYDFDPLIAADDFSPAKYDLTLPRRVFRRSPSWYLVFSLALVCLSIGCGPIALAVDRWITRRKSPLSTSQGSVPG